jgi:hypothetical protein
MRYEIFSEDDGLRWRFVDVDGVVLAAAPKPMSPEECMKAIQVMQSTMDAPVVVLHESPNRYAGAVGSSQFSAKSGA